MGVLPPGNEPKWPENRLNIVNTVRVNANAQANRRGARAPELAKGQIWQMKHACICIVELGNRLLHYKMLDFLGQKGVRTQISGIDVMWNYLRSRHARLVKSGAEA
jgi:hypothetical protein